MGDKIKLDLQYDDIVNHIWEHKVETRDSAKKLKKLFAESKRDNNVRKKRIITIDPISRQPIQFNLPIDIYNKDNLNALQKMMEKLDKLKNKIKKAKDQKNKRDQVILSKKIKTIDLRKKTYKI